MNETLVQTETMAPFFAVIADMHESARTWTWEFVSAGHRLAAQLAHRVKPAMAVRRPSTLSAQVQPFIATPAHGSLPSGHATEAHAVATILLGLIRAGTGWGTGPTHFADTLAPQLMRAASRIAVNRTVAGVHYPIDSACGAMLGIAVGRMVLARVGALEGEAGGWLFDGRNYDGTQDFRIGTQVDADLSGMTFGLVDADHGQGAWQVGVSGGPAVGTEGVTVLRAMYERACAEWAHVA